MPYHHFSNRVTDAYSAEVREIIESNPDSESPKFDDFFVIDDLAITKILSPQKESLLYLFCVSVINQSYYYWLKHVEKKELLKIIEDFKAYRIRIPEYREPSYRDLNLDELDDYAKSELDEAKENYIYSYKNNLRGNLSLKLAEAISKEVVENLFRDRELMKTFNEKVADHINQLDKEEYQSLFNKRGNIVRFSRWPRWLKDALMYREEGRCAIGGEDLTKLITHNIEPNIDHIVPLALGGTNDTSNLQYICRTCNLDKLDHTIVTSNRRTGFFYD